MTVRLCCDLHQTEDLGKLPWPYSLFRKMISCEYCGSKRCAKAEDHWNPCSRYTHPSGQSR